MTRTQDIKACDLFVIGGGINGCGIARDAAGRGLSVVLAEKNDLASATSSASTKMFHGGLRYLEFFKLRLVREALIEREVLLRAMPHISWPMRFVLPYHKDMRFDAETPTSKVLSVVMPWMKGRRPGWLIRLGLFLYDTLGGRQILPATRSVDLTKEKVGAPLQARFSRAYEYSDCWVEDSRLVVLNARDAEARGARVLTRATVIAAKRQTDHWVVSVENSNGGEVTTYRARMLVNAGGPWVGEVLRDVAQVHTAEDVRLVRGSHIVTRKLFDHDRSYFFQGEDGRIIFAIPYETDFTLIGTTDHEHPDLSVLPQCTEAEVDYLCEFASSYFEKPVTRDDVVWSYSGVRPLYDDGVSSATAATRDYVLKVNATDGAPILNVFGGKITTYRKLAESALAQIEPYLAPSRGNWTAGVVLPGGDFPVDGVAALVAKLEAGHPFLGPVWAKRLIRAYGTDAWSVLAGAADTSDLGRDFGATLTEREVIWLMQNEYAQEAADVVWRRSKLGLRLSQEQIATLDDWMHKSHQSPVSKTA